MCDRGQNRNQSWAPWTMGCGDSHLDSLSVDRSGKKTRLRCCKGKGKGSYARWARPVFLTRIPESSHSFLAEQAGFFQSRGSLLLDVSSLDTHHQQLEPIELVIRTMRFARPNLYWSVNLSLFHCHIGQHTSCSVLLVQTWKRKDLVGLLAIRRASHPDHNADGAAHSQPRGGI